jgi:hypothetical protein
MLPDFERAGRIGEFWGHPESRTFAELLIDCEEDRTLPGTTPSGAVVEPERCVDQWRFVTEPTSKDASEAPRPRWFPRTRWSILEPEKV